MESHVASSKIHLLKALEFSGSRVAPYIVARSQITTHNSGASLYGSGATGSRVCRFEINTSVGAMLDLTTLVVLGLVHNLDARVQGAIGDSGGALDDPGAISERPARPREGHRRRSGSIELQLHCPD